MKTYTFNYYDYKKLKAAAMTATATQIDIDTLGEWFAAFGRNFWNGEYYDADDFKIIPVYKQTGEDVFEIEHWKKDC